ncbi:MAG: AMP-binding protein, partial [Chloroherpetonaceae bacterium]|nr:AMP-binding protein [Chloroherpetonaceae bacterium]MDW8019161.1 AMP-binding protein [Chloroherpetonaceae bacterium]
MPTAKTTQKKSQAKSSSLHSATNGKVRRNGQAASEGAQKSSAEISSVLTEKRVFKPSKAFSQAAHIKSMAEYERLYKEAEKDPEKYWANLASQFHWFKKWRKVLEWKLPYSKWFIGGQTNICYNAIDRHLTTWRKNKAAIIWEGEPGEQRVLTYAQLHREVCKLANALKKRGIKKGDRVAIYMGMVPELAIAMLACARIGAVHSVIFGGFSAQAVSDRINDAHAKMVICSDGVHRRGAVLNLKAVVDEALVNTPSVENVIVYQRLKPDSGVHINMVDGRDHWWHDLMSLASDDCPAEPVDAEHPLFILYTSGSTGKPKGILHTTGGYMVHVATSHKMVFDI